MNRMNRIKNISINEKEKSLWLNSVLTSTRLLLSFMNCCPAPNMTVVLVAMYPLRGIFYFITHSLCWSTFFYHLGPLLIVTTSVYFFTISIYMILLILSGGILSFLGSSVLQSCGFIINFINKNILLPDTLKELFDNIINEEMSLGYNKLPRGVLKNHLTGYYGETFLGKIVRNFKRLCHPMARIIIILFLFLINMIPIVGPILVILIKAPRVGFKRHQRYFQLKGYTNAQIHYIWCNKRQFYFTFGVISLLLESIPFLNLFFVFTNTVGIALWTVDIEIELNKHFLKNNIKKSQSQIVEIIN